MNPVRVKHTEIALAKPLVCQRACDRMFRRLGVCKGCIYIFNLYTKLNPTPGRRNEMAGVDLVPRNVTQ